MSGIKYCPIFQEPNYLVCTFLYFMAAFTKFTKSGCGAATVLLYSG